MPRPNSSQAIARMAKAAKVKKAKLRDSDQAGGTDLELGEQPGCGVGREAELADGLEAQAGIDTEYSAYAPRMAARRH